MKRSLLLILGILVAITSLAQEQSKDSLDARWLLEPIKLSSLMVNIHPEYNGWGFEAGRRVSEKLWITSMIEKTKGGDFIKNFDPNYDFLLNFSYIAWINTVRYYLKPEKDYSTFFDAGILSQSASQKFLRNNEVFKQKAFAMGPLIMIGGELKYSKGMYFKWRLGGFINVYRNGSMKGRINDGQNQPSYQLYPHLSDAVIKGGTYAGDFAFGIKF